MTDLGTFLEESADALLPSDAETRTIARLAEQLEQAEAQVERAERALDEAKKHRDKIEQVFLPDALAKAGVTEIRLLDGSRVVVKDLVACGLPKDAAKKAAAIEWLEGNDGGDIVDRTVTVRFKKGGEAQQEALVALLEENEFSPEVALGANYQTLSSWAGEQIEGGASIPAGVFNLFVGKKAKIVKPKKENKDE